MTISSKFSFPTAAYAIFHTGATWFLETRQLLIGWLGEQTGLCLLSKIDWCLDNRPGAAAQPSPNGYEATMSQKKLYRYQQRRLQVQPLNQDTVTRYRDIAPGRHHSVPNDLCNWMAYTGRDLGSSSVWKLPLHKLPPLPVHTRSHTHVVYS